MKEIDTQEHFTVPEGYFENFTQQMMNMLPEQEFQPMNIAKKKRTIPRWTRYAAAACVVGALMISAFTAFYRTDQTELGTSPVAAISTTIADSSKRVIEVVAPAAVKEQPVLAKVDVHESHAKTTSAKVVASEPTRAENSVKNVHYEKQSYDVDLNVTTGYDQNDVEQAAMYMGIDHQDMCEMMYEGL